MCVASEVTDVILFLALATTLNSLNTWIDIVSRGALSTLLGMGDPLFSFEQSRVRSRRCVWNKDKNSDYNAQRTPSPSLLHSSLSLSDAHIRYSSDPRKDQSPH